MSKHRLVICYISTSCIISVNITPHINLTIIGQFILYYQLIGNIDYRLKVGFVVDCGGVSLARLLFLYLKEGIIPK